MRPPRRTVLPISLLAAALCGTGAASASPGAAEQVAPGVTLVRGDFVPGRQPDGNSVLLRGPEGIVVVDTGRHEAHTRRVLEAARAAGAPIVAVVNTHWHLDHVAGNLLLRRAVPGLRIYASGAILDARRGFLADYRRQLAGALAGEASEPQKAEWREEMARIDAGDALVPDEIVTASGTRQLAGREIRIELVEKAVTAGDLWLFDPATETLVAGDLVTLPVPFLDTACAANWRAALDRLAREPFTRLVPGHGPVLDREGFEHYRRGFGKLLDCAATDASIESCAGRWTEELGPLLEGSDPAFVRSLLDYYVGQVLRAGGERDARFCG
jgi:glyoxylase-like metal-dependent hydrolase (beta-lactamase superfamily II)